MNVVVPPYGLLVPTTSWSAWCQLCEARVSPAARDLATSAEEDLRAHMNVVHVQEPGGPKS